MSPRWQRDSHQRVSGIPGAVQNALLNLAANASATFTITATVQPGPIDRIDVTATATPSAGSTASATGTTQVVIFRDGFGG